MRPGLVVFTATAWLFLAALVVQVFLAGLGLFEATDWTAHANLGWVLGSLPVLLLVAARFARLDRAILWPTIGLTIAALVQPELAAARNDAPVIAALHPANALLVFWLGSIVARRSAEQLRAERRASERVTPERETSERETSERVTPEREAPESTAEPASSDAAG